ncbi:hypothetical protein EDB87DRAFT_1688356 [Lactarius vividus]|nr:hypothetical protein EDB87DRAFT_1688356 [Lactarius vividus]
MRDNTRADNNGTCTDHNVIGFKCFAADEAQSLDGIFCNEEGAIDGVAQAVDPSTSSHFAEAYLRVTKNEISMQNPLDAGIKWRPKLSEVAELGPEFHWQEYWDSYFADAPDKPVLRIGMFSALFGNPTTAPPRKYFTLATYTVSVHDPPQPHAQHSG